MSKMGQLLASKKKASAKASVDTALKALSVNDDATDAAKVLKDLKADSAGLKADDWGVDDDDNTEAAAATLSAATTATGGRFYLISEEDVTKKQTNKVARKWGDKDPTPAVPIIPEPPAPVVEEAPAAPTAPLLYSSKLRNKIRSVPKSKLNLEDASLFPELGGLDTPSSSAPVQEEKKSKKKMASAVDDDDDESDDEQMDVTAAEQAAVVAEKVDVIAEKEAVTAEIPSATGRVVLSVEVFLKDVVAPRFNVTIDNDQIQKKYISRKKRPFVDLPKSEVC